MRDGTEIVQPSSEIFPIRAESILPQNSSEGKRVATFCDIMHHPNAPVSFNEEVLRKLQNWQLIDTSLDISKKRNSPEFRQLRLQAKEKSKKEEDSFKEAFNKDPWNFDSSIEGEYTQEELAVKFPRGLEIQQIIKKPLSFLFRAEPGQLYLNLISSEDGRRQVFRELETKRSVEDINRDAQQAPSIIPPFEAIRFEDGKVALLIDWIEGHIPETLEEKTLCLTNSKELIQVPVDSYDFWAGNFLISNKIDPVTSLPKPYYIDRHIPETIAIRGFSPDTTESRQRIFQDGLTKLK